MPARWGRRGFTAQQHQPALDQNHLCSELTSFQGSSQAAPVPYSRVGRVNTSLPNAHLQAVTLLSPSVTSLLPKPKYLCTIICTPTFLHLGILVKHRSLLKASSQIALFAPQQSTKSSHVTFCIIFGKKNNKWKHNLHHYGIQFLVNNSGWKGMPFAESIHFHQIKISLKISSFSPVANSIIRCSYIN